MNLTQSFSLILILSNTNQIKLVQNLEQVTDDKYTQGLLQRVLTKLVDLPPIMPFRNIVYIVDDKDRVKIVAKMFQTLLGTMSIPHRVMTYKNNNYYGCTFQIGVTNTVIQFRTVNFVNSYNYTGTIVDHALFDCSSDFRINNKNEYASAVVDITNRLRG